MVIRERRIEASFEKTDGDFGAWWWWLAWMAFRSDCDFLHSVWRWMFQGANAWWEVLVLEN